MKQNLQECSHALPHSEYNIVRVSSVSNIPILLPVFDFHLFLFSYLPRRNLLIIILTLVCWYSSLLIYVQGGVVLLRLGVVGGAPGTSYS